MKILIGTFTMLSLLNFVGCSSQQKVSNLSDKREKPTIIWIGALDKTFSADLNDALGKLQSFAGQYNWAQLSSPGFIEEVRHFETKFLFDSELRELSGGTMKDVPATYVALMDKRILRVISWQAYKKVHPTHTKEDYVRVLQHEMAHQLHIDLVGDEGMGPVWFYEGFAVVAAGQYEDAKAISASEIKEIIHSENRGSYEGFGFVMRHLLKKHSLPQLVKWAALDRKRFMENIGY